MEPKPQYTYTRIIDLRPNMRNINVRCIILERSAGMRPKHHDGGVVYHALVADETACIPATFWDIHGEFLRPGDIVHIISGLVNMHKSTMNLSPGRRGRMERIGDFRMLLNEQINMGMVEWEENPATKTFTAKNPPPGVPLI